MSQLHRNVAPTIIEKVEKVENYKPQHPVLHLPARVRMVVGDHLQNYTEDRFEQEHAEGWFGKKAKKAKQAVRKKAKAVGKKANKYLNRNALRKLDKNLGAKINKLSGKLKDEKKIMKNRETEVTRKIQAIVHNAMKKHDLELGQIKKMVEPLLVQAGKEEFEKAFPQ
jgi:hypothetical protein